MKTTALHKFLLVGLVGAGLGSVLQACGDDETTTESSSKATTGSMTNSSSTGSGTMCTPNTPCETCAATECTALAQACADLSTCNAMGDATAGCLALITCAALSCDPPTDAICVAMMCADELDSAGGPTGEGTTAARNLGECVQMNCDMQCSMGGGGGAGGGAGGAGGN